MTAPVYPGCHCPIRNGHSDFPRGHWSTCVHLDGVDVSWSRHQVDPPSSVISALSTTGVIKSYPGTTQLSALLILMLLQRMWYVMSPIECPYPHDFRIRNTNHNFCRYTGIAKNKKRLSYDRQFPVVSLTNFQFCGHCKLAHDYQ